MTILHFIIYALLAAGGAGVVLVRNPLSQAMVVSIYGMMLSILFLALQAPDVALSEIVIGAVMYPLMVLLAITKTGGKGVK